ncbi:hydantoinase/oxoprolinase family protein [soil metagenome]
MTTPTRSPGPLWLGLDIGGANIKAAHTSGLAHILPFELWKRPDDLPRMLAQLGAIFPAADRVAVTLTAELCDCFATRAEGVRAVLGAVEEAFPDRPLAVWGTDEQFHSLAEALDRPELPAAANWLALATLAARLLPNGPGLLIDIGSTTTDIIPLRGGHPAARGRTDFQRLQTGELVYAGARRTPVMALASELPIHGVPTGLSAELFASTLDVYLTLGAIPADPSDLSTADGRPATIESAQGRLARMVGADRDNFSEQDAFSLAEAADEALMLRLANAADRACSETIGRPSGAVVCGSGEFLARRLAERVIEPGGSILKLQEIWGPLASGAGCAYSVVVLAGEREGMLISEPEGAP